MHDYPIMTEKRAGHPRGIQEPVAVIGVHARFPGAQTLEKHWENLAACRDLICDVPADRWDARAIYGDPASGDFTRINQGGFIEDIDKFDARFFGISPREAKLMDPQQRLALESAWLCVEDAGYRVADLAGSDTGVFIAVSKSDYEELLYRNHAPIDAVTGTGVAASIIPNRISYLFGLNGPSFPIDTACSGSMIALHTAAQSLQAGDCSLAIVGGVSAMLTPTLTISFEKAGMLSADCRSRTFDDSAGGYARGEGVVTVLLKKLHDAERDGDQIYGVIRGSAIGHGGHANSLTAPNAQAQRDLLLRAWRRAGIDPRTITYIEAHGTGTRLGDPIEFAGIREAYQELLATAKPETDGSPRCGIGSVKTNIGHLEAAAGLAGLVKVLLSMRYGLLPGNPHLRQINPYCRTEGTPFHFLTETRPWERLMSRDGRVLPRRAGISSFGFGGAYGHVLLEERLAAGENGANSEAPDEMLPILPLSAKDDAALQRYGQAVLDFVEKQQATADQVRFGDFLAVYQLGRDMLRHKVAIVADNWTDLARLLKCFVSGIGDPNIILWDNAATLEKKESDSLKGLATQFACRWVVEESANFDKFHLGRRRRRISAPGYPFARTSFWFDRPGQPVAQPSFPAAAAPPPDPVAGSAAGSEMNSAVSLDIVDGGVALVRLRTGEQANMFSTDLIAGLRGCFARIESDERVGAVVVCAEGRVFSMGGTPEWLIGIARGEASFTDEPFLYEGFQSCRVPVISAMEGHAFGGGMLLGLYADIPILSDQGLYSANFMDYGFTPGMGATLLLKEKLGASLATEMMFGAGIYSGADLKQRGVGVLVLDRADVLPHALGLARRIAAMPPPSVRALKREFADSLLTRLHQQIGREQTMHRDVVADPAIVRRLEERFASNAVPASPPPVADLPPLTRLTLPPCTGDHPPAQGVSGGLIALKPLETPADEPGHSAEAEKRIPILCGIVGKILHLNPDEFDADTRLRDIGLDSINSVELANGIASAFGLVLPGDVIQQRATIRELAGYVGGMALPKDQPPSPVPVAAPRPVEAEAAASSDLDRVLGIVCRVLHLAQGDFDPDTPLKEIGLDSINAVEIAREIDVAFKTRIGADDLLRFRTPRALAKAVAVSPPAEPQDIDTMLTAVLSGEVSVETALAKLE